MNTPLSWIKDYVPDLDVTPKEYADKITLTGTKVESITTLSDKLKGIYIGEILSVTPHPNADKLVVCNVNVGNVRAQGVDDKGNVQIITGAPNITTDKVGSLVPVVLDGGMVAASHKEGNSPSSGIEIKAGKLRGLDSYGMMCSIEELGQSRNFYPLAPEDGIYIFDKATIDELGLKPGDDAIKAFGLDDAVIEYEITSNRVDCYSVIGIAREAAATFNKEFILPKISEKGNAEDINDYLKVELKDTKLCRRYTARMIKNINFAPSPEWMQKRLRNAGIRPINNLVDITNFVMLEYGEPMHAFDYDTLNGHKIIVKCASKGDTFETLDGQVRNLDDTVLMINDNERAVGIAGIMGGENSKITENVKSVVFECANFDGINIRLSSKKIGLRTDASSIFEKGLDPAVTMSAVNRACELVEELHCGEVVGGVIDIYPEPEDTEYILLKPDKINSLLGTDFTKDEMIELFNKIDLKYDNERNAIRVPSFRRDLHETCDLAEEVLRLSGYDKIVETLPVGEATTGKLSPKLYVDSILRDTAEYNGFSHIMTYAFESPKAFDLLQIPAESKLRKAIVISNPLGEDFSIMRTQPLNAVLTALSFNFSHKNENVMLYDLANIYIPDELPLTKLPDEREELSLIGYGADLDFYFFKGVIEEIFAKLGMKDRYELKTDIDRPYLHDGIKADIYYRDTFVGFIGKIHPLVAKNYGFKNNDNIYTAVLDVPNLLRFVDFDRKFSPIDRNPAVTRDLSLNIPKELTNAEVENIIYDNGGKLLTELKLYDIYKGLQVKPGYKSFTYTLTLKSDHTLSDDEITATMDKIIKALNEAGIELRA